MIQRLQGQGAPAALLLVLLSASCEAGIEARSPAGEAAAGGVSSSPPAAAPPSRQTLSSRGGFRVSYVPSADPIPLNRGLDLEVAVRRPSGPAAGGEDLSLSVWAEMPAHNHGLYVEPGVRDLGDGSFRIEGMLFHMAGHWVLNLDLERGALTERASFDVLVE